MMRQWLISILFSFCIIPHAISAQPPASAVASATSAATDAGMEILRKGGNAFDAAIAVAAVLDVVDPSKTGIGGGGFWLLYDATQQLYFFLDGREVAPQAATRDMYLDAEGNVDELASLDGPLSAAIPGEAASMVYLAENYGKLPLTTTLAPAIHYAENGFPVDSCYQDAARMRLDALQASPAAAAIFLENNQVPSIGYTIVQKDLANVLKNVAEKGNDGFYHGKVAEALVSGTRKAGGIWTLEDLANYKITIRKPLVGTYKGTKIITAPPPSAGGVSLITILNMLENFKLSTLPDMTQMQVIIESMRRAFWDRASYLGDPAFVKMPLARLLSKKHAKKLASTIELNKATPSGELKNKSVDASSSRHTTHFSILDQEGNMVAVTSTINYYFGSGFVPPGTGVLLNDEMEDFASKVGEQDVYGLVGSEANVIAPGKIPLSSMTPTFLLSKNRTGILGVPGGSRIPTMVLLATLDFMRGHLPDSWVSLKRYHHQYLPDQVEFEINSLSEKQKQALRDMGYTLDKAQRQYGDMHAVLWDKKNNKVYAASDPRRKGKALVETIQSTLAVTTEKGAALSKTN